MPISRPCLPMKDNGSQDPTFKIFYHISLWKEVVVLKGPYFKVELLLSLCVGPHTYGLGAWCLAGPLVLAFWRLQIPVAPACFMFHASILDPVMGLCSGSWLSLLCDLPCWSWEGSHVPSFILFLSWAGQSTVSYQRSCSQHSPHLLWTGSLDMGGTPCGASPPAHSSCTMTLTLLPFFASLIRNWRNWQPALKHSQIRLRLGHLALWGWGLYLWLALLLVMWLPVVVTTSLMIEPPSWRWLLPLVDMQFPGSGPGQCL